MFIHFFIYAAYASEVESNIKFERFSVEDGLAQSNVFSTFIDSQGFLWAGTEDGLSRFDGYTFRTFKHQSNNPYSISSNLVYAIDEDKQGNLWFGTQGGGLNKFNPLTEKFSHYYVNTTSSLDNHIRSVVVDSRNNIWVGTVGGRFYLFNSQLGTFKQYHLNNHQEAVSDGRILVITEDRKGNLWIGTQSSGVFHFNPKTHEHTHYYHDSNNPQSLTSNYVLSITEDKHGYIWIGTFGGGLNKFDPKTEVFQSHFSNDMDSLRNENITLVKADNSGCLWVGTVGKGFYRYDFRTHSFNQYLYNPSDSTTISDDIPFTFSVDKQGNIWIGTLGGGLNRFNPRSQVFSHYRYDGSKNKGLSNNDIRAITEDSYGNHWIGTIGGGLNRFDSKTQIFESYIHRADDPNSLSDNDVLAIKFDSNKNLWVGTRDGGLSKYNYQTNDFTKVIFKDVQVRRDYVRSIIEDSQGNLWLGTVVGEVLVYNPKTLSTVSYKYNTFDPTSLSNAEVFTIFEDTQRNVWVGTFGGGLSLFNSESKSFTHYLFDKNNATSISDNEVITLFEDSKHRLWIGTYGGGLNLFDIKTGIFTHFKEKDGLANNVVYAILEDNNNNLWISTNKGISKFNPETGIFKNYDVGDGLQGNEFNSNAAYKNSKGELYFGGFNGFNKFDPKNITEDKQSPKVVITDMLLLNRTVPIVENKLEPQGKHSYFTLDTAINLTKEIVLSHRDNIVTFEFSALHFTNTKKNNFAYQLVGWDSNWVNTNYKNRRATYTNLPSGDYIFRVKASNADGYWNEEGASLKITILPPPWKTWWAYTLYGLFILSLLLVFIRTQRKKVLFERHLNVKLESAVLERTAELKSSNDNLEAVNTKLESANNQLEELSLTDQLTGLRNRRFLVNNLQNDIDLILRKNKEAKLNKLIENVDESDLLFFLIDLDHFKQVNDIHGHTAGDAVLIQFKSILKNVFRESDYLVRWGGEEFLVIARYTDRNIASELAERLRKGIEEYSFDIGQGILLKKTCSIGYASFPFLMNSPECLNWEQVVDIADHCMYAAKKSNRNAWVGLENVDSSEDKLFLNITQKTQTLINLNQLNVESSITDKKLIKWE